MIPNLKSVIPIFFTNIWFRPLLPIWMPLFTRESCQWCLLVAPKGNIITISVLVMASLRARRWQWRWERQQVTTTPTTEQQCTYAEWRSAVYTVTPAVVFNRGRGWRGCLTYGGGRVSAKYFVAHTNSEYVLLVVPFAVKSIEDPDGVAHPPSFISNRSQCR